MALFPSNTMLSSIAALFSGGTPYLALYTTNPTAADTGTEVTGGSYARQAITFGSLTGGSISNTGSITFSGLPAGTVTHFGIRSAASGGTLRGFGPLNSSAVVIAGDEITFNIGALQVSIAGS